jgi:hypothetical protein
MITCKADNAASAIAAHHPVRSVRIKKVCYNGVSTAALEQQYSFNSTLITSLVVIDCL